MLPIFVDAVDQLRQGLAPPLGDLSQAIPKRVFQADAGLVAVNENGTFGDRRFHDCPPTELRRRQCRGGLVMILPGCG